MVYKLIFYVSTPVIQDGPLHLDAILSGVHPANHNRDTSLTRVTDASSCVQMPLPIDSARSEAARVWCCSAGQFDELAQEYCDERIKKATTASDYQYLYRPCLPSSGPTRDQLKCIRGFLCKHMYFLISSTKAKEIMRIAKRVRGLGSMRRMGYGEVTSFELMETDSDWRECLVSNNVAMRNLPAGLVNDTPDRLVATRPPYWFPANLESGIPAGERCSLSDTVHLKVFT